ncbi:MAG: GGDEF domain-containing protein, partial [Gammaproteobacteria bacterium]
FRYGGEEFCIFSAGLDAAEAAMLARNILEGVRGLQIPHVTGERGVLTVSVGLAQRTQLDSESVEGLLRRADEALYRAKRGGRDRVECGLVSWPEVAEPAV